MERFRLTILAESRIRWKMYVRFGGEYWETYLGNKTRRRVLSLHNQVVKVVNSHFSNVAIPHQIAALEQRMRELKAFSIKILNLAKQAKEQLLDYWFVLPFMLQIKRYFFISSLCFKGGDDLCHHMSSRYI